MEAKSHSKSKKTIGDEPPSLQKTKEYENKIKIDDSNWYKISTTETLKRLDSNKELGLKEEDISLRHSKYGKNNLTETKKQSKLVRFLKQFNNSVIYILLVAGILTLSMHHISDTIVIGIVVLVNALIGYIQENKAENEISQIKQMLVIRTTVIRNGERFDIDASELVPGDIVYLEAGDNVPADIRILEANNLKIQESVLTGEADSVEKDEKTLIGKVATSDQTNMAFASTSVTNGDMIGVVVATGDYTEIGKINQSINNVKQQKTPLIISINNLGKYISYAIVLTAILLFAFGVLFDIYEIPVLLLSVVTMVVGSIPEGLPAITSVILAIGVQNMARKNSIVKNLPSVETLGSVNIIATDKTGTLTKNEMTIKDIVTKRGIADQFEIASAAASTEEIWNGVGNPVYPPAREELARHGISCKGKRAVQLTASDYDHYDYLIGMDSMNMRNIERMTGHRRGDKIYKMLEFAGRDADVRDPWYSGNFRETYEDVVEGCQAFLDWLTINKKLSN